MGVMPIDKLIISMSLPIMISMLVQALYNVVDSVFVARVSENALTAVSMAFPIQNLMIAFGVGTAVGVNALMARSLGEKDFKRVNLIAENAVFLVILTYILFLIIGLFMAEPFFRSQTDIEEIVTYGKDYIAVCCCLSFGIFFQTMPQMLLKMFDASENMLYMGIPALRIISISFIFAGFCIACGSVFQALGYAVYSMIVSVARQLIVLLPVAFALAQLGNVNYVWWAIPAAEFMSLIMTLVFLIRLNRNVISKIGHKE